MPTIAEPQNRTHAGPLVLRATSDLHLSERTAPIVFAALAELQADANAHKGHTILAGDIFDTAITMHMPTFNRLRSLLQTWPDQVTVLAGNHDQWGLGPSENALMGLQGGRCRVITRPAWTRLGRFIPYTAAPDFAAALTEPACPRADAYLLPIVWAHHGFLGAYRNAMSTDDNGVSCQDIPPGHLVITGHYHMPQTLGRVIYCGSPYETSFAEEGQQKGWLRWADALTDPMPKRIAYGDIGAPRHITVHWDPASGPPMLPPHARPIDRIRVKTMATRDEVKDHAEALAAAGLAGVPVLAKVPALHKMTLQGDKPPQHQAEQYVIDTSSNPSEMLDYAEEANLWTP